MEVRLADEALFVIPASGALWTFDFGNKTETLREAAGENQGPMFQVAQARAGDSDLLLVLPTFSAPTIAEQDRIRTLLNDHDRRDPTRGGNVRPVALVIEHSVGKAVVVTEARPLGAKIAAIAA
ncbi:MAG: hypothetical protein KC431_26635, partial [Myxococcales bacterium]|nr:hypothetical protein [Myxococcales bacterium]